MQLISLVDYTSNDQNRQTKTQYIFLLVDVDAVHDVLSAKLMTISVVGGGITSDFDELDLPASRAG